MAKTSGKYGEFGKTGLPVYSGRVYSEIDKTLTSDKWQKAVREMSETDSTIGALLYVITMIARQAEWRIVPFSTEAADEDNALFVRQCMFEDMQQTWQDTVAEILTFLPWGWSWFEMVFKRRAGDRKSLTGGSRFTDGRIGFRKWAIRAQESLYEWQFDDWDEVEAMVQMPEPDFIKRTIPLAKSLHFRTTSHKQNPEGFSILRRAYRDFYFKRHFENIEGIGIERELAGMPKIGAPKSIFKGNANPDDKAMLTYLQNLGENIRQNETAYVLYPREFDAHGNETFSVELMNSSGERAIDIGAAIERKDQRMLMSVLADFLMLGAQKSGSYSLGEVKVDTFLKATKTYLDTICDVVNRRAIPLLLKFNGLPMDRAPYLEAGSLENIPLEVFSRFVDTLVKAGIIFSDEEKQYLKSRGNIPVDANPQYKTADPLGDTGNKPPADDDEDPDAETEKEDLNDDDDK